MARTKRSNQEFTSILSGSEVIAVLALLGLIYSGQVSFALKLFLWFVIGLVCFHFVMWSQWTRRWNMWGKLACLAMVLPIIAWLGYKSLDDGPNVHIVGTLPVHLWETVSGPDSVPFVHHRLGFIMKVRNNSTAPAHADRAVLEGCAKIPLLVAEGMLIDGEALPKPLKIDETLAALERSTIQAIRASGTIRKDSEEISALSTVYVGVLFASPWPNWRRPRCPKERLHQRGLSRYQTRDFSAIDLAATDHGRRP